MKETMLRWTPAYSHKDATRPPASTLTADTAGPAYETLRDKLAINKHLLCPAEHWEARMTRYLFQPNGFKRPVCWMPTLQDGWRRLRFDEFCAWYGLPPYDGVAA